MFKKNNNDNNCLQKSSPELRKTRLPPSLRIRRGFVRRNVIGHHRWNVRKSTNQLRQHISHMKYGHVFLVLSFGVEDQKYGHNWSRKGRLTLLTALESQRMTFKSFDVGEKAGRCHKSEVLAAFTAGFFIMATSNIANRTK